MEGLSAMHVVGSGNCYWRDSTLCNFTVFWVKIVIIIVYCVLFSKSFIFFLSFFQFFDNFFYYYSAASLAGEANSEMDDMLNEKSMFAILDRMKSWMVGCLLLKFVESFKILCFCVCVCVWIIRLISLKIMDFGVYY
jgi:hypothetical protein